MAQATEELEETGGNGGTGEESRLVRLLLGSRLLRRPRLRRALIADLLGERGEAGEEDEGEDGGEVTRDDERRLIRVLVGSRILRRRRVRRALLAKLLSDRGEAMGGEEEEEGDEDGEISQDDERNVLRMFMAGRFFRRRRVRRALLANLLSERGEAMGEAGEEEEGEEDGDISQGDERRLIRLLVGSRILRRRRIRRALVAHLLGERGEAMGEAGEEEEGEEGGDDENRRLMRLLIGGRRVRRRRARRGVALAGLLGNGDTD